jgi:DNA-binding Xre family transcriptional regulator
MKGVKMIDIIGKNIRKLKIDRSFTTKQLSDVSGVNENTIKGILQNQANDTGIVNLMKIANALECTVNDLLKK